MKDKIIDRVNLEHNSSDRVDAYLVETWVKEEKMINLKNTDTTYQMELGLVFTK